MPSSVLPLLLILSALLSALTGAISGVRVAEVGQHQASGPATITRAVATAAPMRRTVSAGLPANVATPAIPGWYAGLFAAPLPTVARYAGRLRE